MAHSQTPVPEGIKRSIANGRYGEAADALRNLVRRERSAAILTALADINLQLGNLTEAKGECSQGRRRPIPGNMRRA